MVINAMGEKGEEEGVEKELQPPLDLPLWTEGSSERSPEGGERPCKLLGEGKYTDAPETERTWRIKAKVVHQE